MWLITTPSPQKPLYSKALYTQLCLSVYSSQPAATTSLSSEGFSPRELRYLGLSLSCGRLAVFHNPECTLQMKDAAKKTSSVHVCVKICFLSEITHTQMMCAWRHICTFPGSGSHAGRRVLPFNYCRRMLFSNSLRSVL